MVVDPHPHVPWLEVHIENYIGGGKAATYLDAIRRSYPLALNGVGLSLGSAEGIDDAHLERIRVAVQRFEPGLVSEHLAWNVADGSYLADLLLLPLPMTEEALDLFCRNVDRTQTHLQRRILIENPSSYLQFNHSSTPEWEFLATVSRRTGCGILCDVNNIYASACNHGWDVTAYLEALPAEAVGETHLAGHAVRRSLVERDDGAAAVHIVNSGLAPEQRLAVYRNTFDGNLANALRLSFPAVYRLVGAELFEKATLIFTHQRPPCSAWLDEYGAEFPDFLADFPQAASLPYFPDATRLEWAVNRALHAPDVGPFDAQRLAALDPAEHERVRLIADPAVSLLQLAYPVDAIWRAVLAQGDAALGAVDLAVSRCWLLVERRITGVEVTRLNEQAWRFMDALVRGLPLGAALEFARSGNSFAARRTHCCRTFGRVQSGGAGPPLCHAENANSIGGMSAPPQFSPHC